MHSVGVSSQLLVSVLFIVVPTNTENCKHFCTLDFFNCIAVCTIESMLFLLDNSMAMI